VTDVRDVAIVGAGPNGLAAALTLARAGRSVVMIEAADEVGGGVRSAELTLPGFVHDVCSAIHPFGRISPFFAGANLAAEGLRWVEPPIAIGHPLDDGSAVVLTRDVERTAAGLGPDSAAYRRLLGPIVRGWDRLMADILAPFHVPLSPLRTLAFARFGFDALQPATMVARRFRGERARALFAGAAAHSVTSLSAPASAAAGLVMLGSAHADGWPFPEGGSARLAQALVGALEAHGVAIVTGRRIATLADLPPHRVAMLDVTPRQLLSIAGDRLSGRERRGLRRFRYGAGTFKLDIAIEGAIPWRASELLEAGMVHLGGTLEEIARGEAAVAAGRVPERPFVLLAQHSLFDRTRAPEGRNTVWAYCHVPNGSTAGMTEPILAQVERFAPGFRERVLAVSARGPADLEAYNANNVGGDITGGHNGLPQLLFRPRVKLDPYATSDPAIFLCSASTPPGGGVHGMCGLHAARSVERRLRRG
jgi:phytoene dehydrogenase-like protein